MTYFRTPGPPQAKLKGGPGYEARVGHLGSQNGS